MPDLAEKITAKNAFLLYFAVILVSGIYFLMLLVSATIRRLNHAGLSKWWALLIAILLISMLLVTRLGDLIYFIELISMVGLTAIWLWPGKK